MRRTKKLICKIKENLTTYSMYKTHIKMLFIKLLIDCFLFLCFMYLHLLFPVLGLCVTALLGIWFAIILIIKTSDKLASELFKKWFK